MNPFYSKSITTLLLFLISYNSFTQTNAEKDAFAETFIKIFQQRANGFDSITNFKVSTIEGFDAKIKFPGAEKCLIKDNKYVAEYAFKDSMGAISFFGSLQNWLNYAASAYNSKALFIPLYDNPRQLKFFLSDSSGFIHAENYLSFSQTKKVKPFTVELEIDSERAMSYYTNYGERISNSAINTFINEVGFGNDLLMTKIKKNKKKIPEGYSYESTRTLPGYTASIFEYIDDESEVTENKLELVKKWSGHVKTVNQKVDSLILGLKSALPSSYCYQIDGEQQTVSFYQHPFSKEKLDAEFTITYGLNEGKKDSYYLALIISRIRLIETKEEKEEVELYPFKDVNGKYGYRDKDKKIIVPGKYDKAASFREERACVELNKKQGFIDITGKEIIPLKYDFASLFFFDGLAEVRLNGKYGMIDIYGKEIIPVKYDEIDKRDSYSDEKNSGQSLEFIMVKLQGKYGFIDKNNREIVPLKYDYAKIIGAGIARVSLNKKEGIINNKGKEIIPVIYDAMNTDGYKEYGSIKIKINEKWGLLDNTGKLIIPAKYDFTGNGFFEGLAWVNLDDKYGFIDKTGKEVIPRKYFSVDNFSEGLAAVRLNGKYGFIDKTGKEVIALKYEDCESFTQGLAAAKLNGKWGYIDKTNKTVVPFKYDKVEAFDEYGQAKVYIGKKWGKINTRGVVVKPIENEDADDDDEW
jgi:hypothetical protein